MLTLFHHPDCPHSRFVRLILREYDLPVRQVIERTWERREEFLILNPAGTTPVLVCQENIAVPDASIIAEYVDETYGKNFGDARLFPVDISGRIEVRRLLDWFNGKFFKEVSGPLTDERYKHYMMPSSDSGRRDHALIADACQSIEHHVAYIESLLSKQDWLAGVQLSYADLAAVAHLSVTDYFCKAAWNGYGRFNAWHERMRSRQAFQSVLTGGWRS
jgi:glutathione S-transferase